MPRPAFILKCKQHLIMQAFQAEFKHLASSLKYALLGLKDINSIN